MGAQRRRGLAFWRFQSVPILTQPSNGTGIAIANVVPSDDWQRGPHTMTKDSFGVWEITLPAVNGEPAIPHNSKLKVRAAISNLLPTG